MTTLLSALRRVLPARQIISDALRRLAYGTDASFYRLVPQLIVFVENEAQLCQVLRVARQLGQHLTFRAAGTSLSGQALSDGLLVVIGEGFASCEISADAGTVRLGPGLIAAEANRRLAPFGRKIGPDPASIDTCKIGGIAANNASGMCCGTAQNSYQTLRGMRVVLANGALLDTEDAASVAQFRREQTPLLEELAALGAATRANPELAQLIRHKYKIKNTTGYSLNSLVDYSDPIDILIHLMIGSEGTLGFISRITYQTVPDYAHKSSALVFFPDIATACAAVLALKPLDVSAVELLDRASLRSVENKPGLPDIIKRLGEAAAALLIEVRAEDDAALAQGIVVAEQAMQPFATLQPVRFSLDAEECAMFWKVRKGTFPSVGAMRVTGTTVIIEDVAFPLQDLAAATLDLQALLLRHGYHEAIIFGHALEGNLHFVFTQDFASHSEVERYRRMMDEVCALVVGKYRGSLKAEHGTGRNMAPFVELEWGAEAMTLMRRIKRLFDPDKLLNPGVIINDNPNAHLDNLKPLPPADALVDKCIECGFCEPQCPSHQLTLSPRQRITGLREMARRATQDAAPDDGFSQDYLYMGLDTCAGCGLCADTCPVGINTGDMIRKLRGRRQGALAKQIGGVLAANFGVASSAARSALRVGRVAAGIFGDAAISKLSGGAWRKSMPRATAAPRASATPGGEPLVYFPTCGARIFGGEPGEAALSTVVIQLLQRAGFAPIVPDGCDSLCCGQPFASKGLQEAGEAAASALERELYRLSDGGRIPVLLDASPCAARMKEKLATRFAIHDFPEFAAAKLLPRLKVSKQPGAVALHLNCSARRQGEDVAMHALASACCEEVIVPMGVKCCGFGGDRGFAVPELNQHALRHIHEALPTHCHTGVSSNRTCELGLTSETGRHYQSIAYLLERATRDG